MNSAPDGDDGTAPHHRTARTRHADEPYAAPRGFTWSRAFGIAGFVLMAIFWAWAFAHGSSVEHPDEIHDLDYSARAEAVCAKHRAVIDSLPNPSEAHDAYERADLLDRGTDVLAAMVDELTRLDPPTTDKGREIVPQWLGDWGTYLGDRRAYSEILHTGESPPFTLSPSTVGARVTDLLDTFAAVNDMHSCAPSNDV